MFHTLKTVADLEAVYGAPNPRSLLKEIDHLNAERAKLGLEPATI